MTPNPSPDSVTPPMRVTSSYPRRTALDVIAAGIHDVAGFDVVSFCAVRNHNELEVLAVSGDDTRLRNFVGSFLPLQPLLEELERGEPRGRFRFLPAECARMARQWMPAITPSTDENAWQPGDLMVAPLHDGETLIGVMFVDQPADGLRPPPDGHPRLDIFAEHCEKELFRALDYDSLEQEYALTQRLHRIVRRAESGSGVFQMAAEVAAGARDTLSCDRASLQLYDGPPDPDAWPPVRSLDGALSPGDPDLARRGVEAAQRAFVHDTVVLVAEGRLGSSFMEADHHRAVLEGLATIGLASGVQIPLVHGNEIRGSLFLTRSAQAGPWTDIELAAATEFGHDFGTLVAAAQLRDHERRTVERLQELDTYKAHLIRQISHELRSPMTAILGHLELAEDGDLSPDSLAAIRRGAERLEAMADDLLTFNRIDADTTGGRCLPGEVVEQTVKAALESARQQEVEVITRVEPSEVEVGLAAHELGLVVAHLLDNAIKFSDPGSKVEVEVLPTAAECAIRFRDQGIGISEADQARLGQDFFRSEHDGAMSRPGNGVGLGIVRRVVGRLGGRLDIESALGQGTTVTVLLPGAAR